MRRTKILFVVTKSNWGGAQRYVYELATNLPDETYEVAVAFGGGGALKTKLETAGIRTLTIASLKRDISVLDEIRSSIELWRIYKNEQPDIVHLNSAKALGLGALIGRIAGIPRIVSTVHGWPFLEPRNDVWRAFAWIMSWFSALLAHHIILVSRHDRAQFMPLVGNKCTVIHPALPQVEFKPRDEARQQLFPESVREKHAQDIWVVTVAELTRNKNLFAALDAVAAFNTESEWKIFYAILGDGELKDELAIHIEKRGLRHHAMLAGYIEDARTYLKAFDIFLLPSKKEGLPYALLEAGAAGLPAIASDVGGIPEVIRHGESGLLIDPDDVRTITRALRMFVTDPTLRTTCQAALARTVAEQFALPTMVERTRGVYITR